MRAFLIAVAAALGMGVAAAQPIPITSIYGPSAPIITNWVRNSVAAGSTSGVLGSGGVVPTNWTIPAASGVTITIVGTGTEGGIPYIDVKWTSAATGATQFQVLSETTTSIAALNGQAWSHSLYMRLVGGSLSNVNTIQITVTERAAGGTLIQDLGGLNIVPTSAALASQRFATTATMNNATTAFVSPRIFLNVTNGAAIDCTLRIGAPQIERASAANAWVPTTGAVASAGALPVGPAPRS